MSEFKVKGRIAKISETESGISAAGKEWKKLNFVVTTDDKYNSIYPFEVFGDEKVSDFLAANKEGNTVEVEFNIKAREYQGKYFTNLSAWKISGEQRQEPKQEQVSSKTPQPVSNDLPF